jgi:hypothetical protein
VVNFKVIPTGEFFPELVNYAEVTADISDPPRPNDAGLIVLKVMRMLNEKGMTLDSFSAVDYREIVMPFMAKIENDTLRYSLDHYLHVDDPSVDLIQFSDDESSIGNASPFLSAITTSDDDEVDVFKPSLTSLLKDINFVFGDLDFNGDEESYVSDYEYYDEEDEYDDDDVRVEMWEEQRRNSERKYGSRLSEVDNKEMKDY